jgi:mannosyl-oligosaccharide glucosidase
MYICSSLNRQNYIHIKGPYQQKARDIYDKLRENVVGNIAKEIERTGFTWEQYDQETGEGKRSHPFDGWTAVGLLLIITETY